MNICNYNKQYNAILNKDNVRAKFFFDLCQYSIRLVDLIWHEPIRKLRRFHWVHIRFKAKHLFARTYDLVHSGLAGLDDAPVQPL